MDTNLIIKFDSVVAIIHIVCITIQIGIIIYKSMNNETAQKPVSNNNYQGGFRQ